MALPQRRTTIAMQRPALARSLTGHRRGSCRLGYCENAITMQHLILRPGPQLVMRDLRPEPDDTGSLPKEVDFTGRAHELLFELITIHAETTLADIFRLMEASPLLQKFYRRDFAEELCAETRKGAAQPPASQRAAHEGIEFLELYQEWGLDTSTTEYSGMQRLHLHGIGHELAHRGRRHGQGLHERDPAREMHRRDAGPGRSWPAVGTVLSWWAARAEGGVGRPQAPGCRGRCRDGRTRVRRW